MTAALVDPVAADLSVEHRVALLPRDQRRAVLDGLDMDELLYEWRKWAGRPSQILPLRSTDDGGDWALGVVLAGRGFGKTMMVSQWIRELDMHWRTLGRDGGQLRVALLGRTAADVRDVMLEGPSGLLNVWPESVRHQVVWTPSRRRVDLPNGAVCLTFSAEEPDQLRGPQFHVGVADEIAAYKQARGVEDATAWDNLRFAVRLGSQPQVFGATTPKRVPLIRQLLAEWQLGQTKMLLRRGSTHSNRHLSAAYRDALDARFAGTELGRQELDGEVLDDVAGAMTTEAVVQAHRATGLPAGVPFIKLIGVDPTVAERPTDECGIVVVYVANTWPVESRHAWVVEDLSGAMAPRVWADVVVEAATRHGAVVVAEVNQGGALVKQNITTAATAAGVRPPQVAETWSSKAKAVRAESIGARYDRGHVHHVNVLPELEDQITSWTPSGRGPSPDRMDAAVFALTAGLFPEGLTSGLPGQGRVQSAAQSRLPTGRLPTRIGGGRR